MDKKFILVINPGSTSTKISLFQGEKEVKSYKIKHEKEELNQYKGIIEQYDYRLNLIMAWLIEEKVQLNTLLAVVGRGGLLRSLPGGTYNITEPMIDDLKLGLQGEHASNLGAILAKRLGDIVNIPTYIVDPVSVDEFDEVSRISGLQQITRRSLLHALNIKAVSHRRAEELKVKLEDVNFIVAHLGGGISVATVEKGKMIDVNNSIEMGPFSPERSGTLPVGDLVKMCFSGEFTFEEMKAKIHGKGGLISYLGTSDGEEIIRRINNGDKNAKLIYEAMAYQIGKEIGSCASVLKGKVDNIILTGGLAYSKYLVDKIIEMVEFISPIIIYPGEDEMDALNKGVLRVIDGLELPKVYEEEVKL